MKNSGYLLDVLEDEAEFLQSGFPVFSFPFLRMMLCRKSQQQDSEIMFHTTQKTRITLSPLSLLLLHLPMSKQPVVQLSAPSDSRTGLDLTKLQSHLDRKETFQIDGPGDTDQPPSISLSIHPSNHPSILVFVHHLSTRPSIY